MSYGREYLDETAYERDRAIERQRKLELTAVGMASHGLWQTKEGKTLSVKEMETSHIKNCIRMLLRNKSPFAYIYVPMFEKELTEREEE